MKKIFLITFIALLVVCPVFAQSRLTQKQFVIVDENGDQQSWTTITSVTIYDAGTTTESTIYADRAGGTSKTNPIVTGLSDPITFWSRDADFKVTVTDGTYTRTLDNLTGSDTKIVFPTYLVAMATRTASDSQSFTFGSDSDWVAAAQDSTMDWTPGAADSAFAIGTTSYYSDLYLYGGDEGYDLYWDASEDTLELLDNVTLAVGTGDDLTVVHDGSNTTIAGNFIVSGQPTFQTDTLFDGTYDISYDDNRYQLLFEDNAVLGIGGDHDAEADVKLYHDGSDLYLDAIIEDEGWKIGDTTTGFDITYYFEGAGQFRTDYDGDFVNLTDDMDLRFGTGASSDGDFQMSSSSGNVLTIGQIVTGVGTIAVGVDANGIDTTFYGDTASSYMKWDNDGNTNGALLLEAADIALGDGDLILFGDALGTGDLALSSTSAVLSFTQISIGTGTMAYGADGNGIDQTWYSDTESDYMKWDQDGSTNGALIFEDSIIHMMDDTTIVVGDGSDGTIQYDEDGYDGIQVTGPLFGYRMSIENVTANDTLTTAESGRMLIVDGNTADVTLTLPSVGASDDGVWYYIVDANEAEASDVSLAPSDSDTINGSANDFSSDGADELPCAVMVVYDHSNTDWKVFINELGDGTAAWDSE